jgi:predicted MFS family arabinose efflux permease
VGFYYAANALGRFIGTLLSGLLYQAGGLGWALLGSGVLLVACWVVTLALPVSPGAADVAAPQNRSV